jgi:very-short-patch-repair endonuclease
MKHTIPPEHRRFARQQRREPTRAEALMWDCLRAGRLDRWRFKRQVPFGRYVADFSCPAACIVVELDGRPHEDPEQQARDAARDRWFRAQGFRVVRLSNDLVLASIELAVREIERALPSRAEGEAGLAAKPRAGAREDSPAAQPSPSPSPRSAFGRVDPPPERGRV